MTKHPAVVTIRYQAQPGQEERTRAVPHLRAFMLAARELVAGPPTIEHWALVDDVAP